MDISDLSGKRYEYFKKAVNLFARDSYELVSLDDIALAVGKKRTNFYSYFQSKMEILDMMYEFFEYHFEDNRKTIEALRPILERGTVLEIIQSLNYQFPEGYRDVLRDILTVIHQRKYFDEKARKIAKELMVDEGIRYAQEVLNYAIQIGRLAPFNTYWLALVINDTRNGEYMRATLDKDHDREAYIANEETMIYQHAAAMIKDLRPPYSE